VLTISTLTKKGQNEGKPPRLLAHLLLFQHTNNANKSKRASKQTHVLLGQPELGNPRHERTTTANIGFMKLFFWGGIANFKVSAGNPKKTTS